MTMKGDASDEPLHMFDKDEWWDVMRRAKPDITREAFDEHWEEFQTMKRNRKMQ